MSDSVTSQNTNFNFILYSTLGCHLCEDAQQLLARFFPQCLPQIAVCDIALDDDLVDIYGERIPVLERVNDSAYLNWPFDVHQLNIFFGVEISNE